MSDRLSRMYTFQISKSLIICFVPSLLYYLVILYNLLDDVATKLLLIVLLVGIVLWSIYKLTSNYYHGINNSFFSDDIALMAFVIVFALFLILPIIVWYGLDFYNIYILHDLNGTVVLDFKDFLLNNKIIDKNILTKPYEMDPYTLLFLSAVSLQRILLFDITISVLVGLGFIIYFQFKFIVEYFKTKFKEEAKKELQYENFIIERFNTKLQNSKVLHTLFLLFIAFLGWDILAVTYNTYIMPLNPSFFPDISNFIIVTVLLSYFNQLQVPLNFIGIIFLILLFVAVLIVFNIVAVKLREKSIQQSYFGSYYLLSISFLLINGFLLYDLQNYIGQPLHYFQSSSIGSYLDYSYHWFVILVVWCDTYFFLIVLASISLRLTRKYQSYRLRKKEMQEQALSTSETIIEEKSIEEKVPDEQEDTASKEKEKIETTTDTVDKHNSD